MTTWARAYMDMSYDKKCSGVLFCITATGPCNVCACEDVALNHEAVKGVTPCSWVSTVR